MSLPARAASTPLLAFILHRYDWSESSLVLDVFTRAQGRVAVVAKGAKRPYSQLRSVLLPFQKLEILLGRAPKVDTVEGLDVAPREVQTLRSAQWAGGPAMLTGAALFSGFYANELLMKLLARQDAYPVVFDAYAQTLPALASGNDLLAQSVLRAFELVLLHQLGVLPDLGVVTATQQGLEPAQAYRVLPEVGVVKALAGAHAIHGEVLLRLQAALAHGSLAALQLACSAALSALRLVLRALLQWQFGHGVLRTRQVMLGVQSLVGVTSLDTGREPIRSDVYESMDGPCGGG
jgi:DNA repair protein RecO (recombination protein O)